jgi:hypothetical protein
MSHEGLFRLQHKWWGDVRLLYDWRSVSQSWYRIPLWHIPVGMLLSEICGLFSVGRHLWREDGPPICSVITQWFESLRTRNHTLLSHLRLPQPRGPGTHIYIPQEECGPVIPPGTGFTLHRLLRPARLRWRYSNPPRTYSSGTGWSSPKSNDGQSISMSWCLVHSALKGFHPKEFQSEIRRSTSMRNFLC